MSQAVATLQCMAGMAAHRVSMSSTIAIIWGTPPGYELYLRRKLWKTIKARVLERDAHKCVRCGGKADIVHHRTYDQAVLDGLADEWLKSLCDGCHTVVHYDERGFWRSWQEAERVLATPEICTDFPEPVVRLNQAWPVFPDNWKRMSVVQQSRWYQRRHEILLTKRALRDFGGKPIVTLYKTNEDAVAVANIILDQRAALVGKYRDTADHLHIAMLSQGCQLAGKANWIITGIRPVKAKERFDEVVGILLKRNAVAPSEVVELEALGVWHLPPPPRTRRAKKAIA